MKGSCLCGTVTFETPDKVMGLSACHCSQCRKQSGHFWASAHALETEIEVWGDLGWFEASSTAKRGFCSVCGSFLFWKSHDEETMSFALGAVDGATGQKLERHIFTADKGDYYDIADGLPYQP